MAAACLAVSLAAPAAPAGGDIATGVTWHAMTAPFALAFFDNSHPLTAEAGGAIAGPGGRLAYQVGGPDTGTTATDHRLTDVTSAHPVAGGTRYDVDTDEPGRTATVTVTPQHGNAAADLELP